MIDFNADVIDTRDIIARIEELESDNVHDQTGEPRPVTYWPADDRREHKGLSEIIAEVGDSAQHGVTLIHEAHFRDYIKEMFMDCGTNLQEHDPNAFRPVDVSWDDLLSRLPFSCIDWEKVADECASDYSALEIDGTDFYYQEA